MFVTAQGSALTRYRRALERRHIFGAEIAAKECSLPSPRPPARTRLGLSLPTRVEGDSPIRRLLLPLLTTLAMLDVIVTIELRGGFELAGVSCSGPASGPAGVR